MGATQVGNRLYLVMEYCAGGDLAAYLAKHKRVSEETARGLMRQLAAGLKELWSHHLVHVSRPAVWLPPTLGSTQFNFIMSDMSPPC